VTPGLLDHEEKGGEPIRYKSDPVEGPPVPERASSGLNEQKITQKHDPTQFG